MATKTPRNAFWNYFEDLEDPRDQGRNFTYSFESVVVLAVMGICCDQNSFTKIVSFLTYQWKWFAPYFPDHDGPPSRSTFQRVFSCIDAAHFESCFSAWTASIQRPSKTKEDSTKKQVIAIDGKTIRNSGSSGSRPLHLVSAWASATGLVLGQRATEEKSNEITAIPKLIETLDLRGSVVTIDAMGCQKKIAAALIDAKADYLLAAKGNHKTMFEEIKSYFASVESGEQEATDFHEESDKGHGRIETRSCWITTDVPWFENREEWKNISMLARVQATRITKGKTTVHNRYYISSLKDEPASEILRMTREHWGIENKLHWVLDVSFGEDNACIREKTAAHNIASAKRLAMNALKTHPRYPGTLSTARIAAAFDLDFREILINSMA